MSAIKSAGFNDKFVMMATAKIKHKRIRSEDEEQFDELKASIYEFGLIEPIIIAPVAGDGKYNVVAGNRRFRACSELKMKEVPAIVKTGLDKTQFDILTLIENVQRRDLTDTEKANGVLAIYNHIGFSREQALTQLSRMSIAAAETKNSNFRIFTGEQRKKYNIDDTFWSYSKITGFAYGTIRTFLEILDIDSDVLAAAEESGLHIRKKRLITRKGLKRHGEKKVHKRTQKEALRRIKSSEDYKDAKRQVEQLEMDVRTGAFDPDSAEIYDNMRDRINYKIESDMSGTVNDISYKAKTLLAILTGYHPYRDIDEAEIPKREGHMIDIAKKVNDKQIAAMQSFLVPLRKAVDMFVEVLYDEVESRKKKGMVVKR